MLRSPGKANISSLIVENRKDSRRSNRRRTIAIVTFLDGSINDKKAIISNVSKDGAYIVTSDIPPVGSRLAISFQLPANWKRPIKVDGRVVRIDAKGSGILFEDIRYQDRFKIRQYADFADQDDAIVALQNSMKNILTGNLLPVREWPMIEERLIAATKRNLQVLVALSANDRTPFQAGLDYKPDILQLQNTENPIPKNVDLVYYAILDGPLQAVFQGLLLDKESNPRLVLPERMYHNDRRCSYRHQVEDTWMSIDAPHMENGVIRLPVSDVSEGGCSFIAPKNSLITIGMRLPSLKLESENKYESHDGGTITRIAPTSIDDQWLVGVSYFDNTQDRDVFSEITDRSVHSSTWSKIIRVWGLTKDRIRKRLPGKLDTKHEDVYVCRYKNTKRENIVGIIDATFDLHQDPPPVDVGVLICQPFQVRKEIFNILARTLLDNFKRDGISAIVQRFDMTYMIGESDVDPNLEGQECHFKNWTYSQYESDMVGSISYMNRRFNPKKKVLITLSVAAIPARHLIVNNPKLGVDQWIAPFGCPDGQDQWKNYMGGTDLFKKYMDGKTIEPVWIWGRLGDPNPLIKDAIKNGTAFLEEARKDMEKITIPVTWILGTYDYIVTRERIKQMLSSPGGGVREIIELPAGHLLRTGPEAIESYKIISESISKHMLNSDKEAIEPNLAAYVKQNEAEWARIKREKVENFVAFWDRHLFGASDDVEGYDIFLYNKDYMDLITRQAKLLDVKPGQKVADFGCGTGNLSMIIIKEATLNRDKPVQLCCSDLVPKAIQRTKEKLDQALENDPEKQGGAEVQYRVINLESGRLAPIKEFLSGKLYGPVALAGRVEGLHTPTLRKIAKYYGTKLHDILHGTLSDVNNIKSLCHSLDDTEAETVLELSVVARFLNDTLLPEDLIDGKNVAETTDDLKIEHLNFGKVNRDCRIDFQSEEFDKIGVSIVLPYLYDPLSVLKEFHRILAPGGKIVLSSPKPNYDSSKSYLEEADAISKRTDLDSKERERLLKSLQQLAAFIAQVIELEDEGRFRFFSKNDLINLMKKAGFTDIKTYDALGTPPTTIILSAGKE